MTDSSITYWGVEVGVGVRIGVEFGVGVIVFIVTGAAIVSFLVPSSPPVVFPSGNAGAYETEMTKLAKIIINNAIAPTVMEKYCLYFASCEYTWGEISETEETWT